MAAAFEVYRRSWMTTKILNNNEPLASKNLQPVLTDEHRLVLRSGPRRRRNNVDWHREVC